MASARYGTLHLLSYLVSQRTDCPSLSRYGAWATAGASWVGSFPWFATYNWLQEAWPTPPEHDVFPKLLRQAVIGFVASVVSDTVSNSLRVVKTYRQVNQTKIGYRQSLLSPVLTPPRSPSSFGREQARLRAGSSAKKDGQGCSDEDS